MVNIAPQTRRRGLSPIPSMPVLLIALLAACGLPGCASPARTELSNAELQSLHREDDSKAAEEFAAAIDRLVAGARNSNEINLLALSGGGDYGAFGTGFLLGWGTADHPNRRPSFDGVSGVSTGALIAPFAFVGTDEALTKVDSFYRNPSKDWIESRGWFFFLPMFPSFMEIPGLSRDVKNAVDGAFLTQVAERAAGGRVLLVSATNLDFATQRVWDLGGEATRAATPEQRDRIHRMLFASSAIPAVFPPVELDGFLFADGGVTANVLLRLDPEFPNGFIQKWKRTSDGRPVPPVRYWIIVNNQLNPPPKTVQPKWPGIAAPSIATAIRSATFAEVRWLAAQADYVNSAYGTDIQVRSVAIPDDWRAPVEGDFQKPTMESLSDLGRKLGADPASWKLWTKPKTSGQSN